MPDGAELTVPVLCWPNWHTSSIVPWRSTPGARRLPRALDGGLKAARGMPITIPVLLSSRGDPGQAITVIRGGIDANLAGIPKS